MRNIVMSALAVLLAGAVGIVCAAQGVGPGSFAAGSNGIILNAAGTVNGSRTLPPQRGGFPSGDYKTTCRDMRMNGSWLQARCQKRDGGWRATSLDTRSCSRGIVNDNGYLRCSANGGYGPGRPPYGNNPGWAGGIPRGDYRRTCQNIRISGQRLDATCQKANGGWRSTSLKNFYRCGNQISNVDGHLRCGR